MSHRFTPVHRSLLEVKSTAGAEFILTLGNAALCGVMLFGPRLFWWIGVYLVIQRVLRWMFFRDPQFSLVISRYVREGDSYDPWIRPGRTNKRPLGLGRDLPLC